MTEEERRQRLLRMGLDPTKYRYVTNEEKALRSTTMGSAALTGVKQSVGPTAGGAAGALLGAKVGAVGGPIGALAGSLIGGIAGGFGGGAVQSAVEEAALDEADQAALMLERQAAAQKYPTTTFLSQVAPSLLLARPSLTQLKALPGAIRNAPLRTQSALEKYALMNAGIGSGLEAGVEAGTQAIRGEEMDYSRIGLAGLVGGTLTQPWLLGKKVYGSTEAPLPDMVRDESGKLIPNPALMEQLEATREKTVSEVHKKFEEDKQLAEARIAAQDKANADAEAAKRDETTAAEDVEASRTIKEEKSIAEQKFRQATKEHQAAEANYNRVKASDGEDSITAQNAKRILADKEENLKIASTLFQNEMKLAEQSKQVKAKQAAEAADLLNQAAKRQQAVTGKSPEIPALSNEQLLSSAKGLAAKLGVSWRKAVPMLLDRYGKKSERVLGTYNLHGLKTDASGEVTSTPDDYHSIQLKEKSAKDTPFHEYVHAFWQVAKRSADAKVRALFDYFETGLFANNPKFKAMDVKSRRIWAEEQMTERSGKALLERMEKAPQDWYSKVGKWFDDWKLEREARKGFVGAKGVEGLERMAEWIAMRAERQPALQPVELESLIRGLAVSGIESGPRFQTVNKSSEIQSRVGGLIRDVLRENKKESIKKTTIDQALKSAKKNNYISDEDVKWNQEVLDEIKNYGGSPSVTKIPKEVVEDILDGLEYVVDIVEESTGSVPHEDITYVRGNDYKIRTLVMPSNKTSPTYWDNNHADFGAGANAIGWHRSNTQHLTDNIDSYHIIEVQSPLHQEAATEGYARPRDDYEEGRSTTERLVMTGGGGVLSSYDPGSQNYVLNSNSTPLEYISDVDFVNYDAKEGSLFHIPKQLYVSGADTRKLPSTFERGSQKFTAQSVIQSKLSAEPSFEYFGHKFNYNAETDQLKATPVSRSISPSDLTVTRAGASYFIGVPKQFRADPQELTLNDTIGSVSKDMVPKGIDFDTVSPETLIDIYLSHDKGFLAYAPRREVAMKIVKDLKGEVLRDIPEDYSDPYITLEMSAAKRADGTVEFHGRIEPHEFDGIKKRVIPDVPFKDKRWLNLIVRDAVMAAVESGKDSVTWPTTVKEVNGTEQWGKGFHKSFETGNITKIYDYYLAGTHTAPDGSTHTFKGAGDGKNSRLDEAFNKFIKDFKAFGTKPYTTDSIQFESVYERNVAIDLATIGERFDAAKSGEDEMAVWANVDQVSVRRFDIPKALRDKLLRDGGIESSRFQSSDAVLEAVDIVAMHDPELKGKYSKRVRDKLTSKTKEDYIQNIQQVLARFASRPFPEDMSGEDIAKVVNGMKLYHGSRDAASVLREGFDAEKLRIPMRPYKGTLGGIYMTSQKEVAQGYASADTLTLRTNFKKLFDIDKVYTSDEITDFLKAYKKASEDFGHEFDIETASKFALESVYAGKPFWRLLEHFFNGKSLNPRNPYFGPGASYFNMVLSRMGYDGLTHSDNVSWSIPKDYEHRVIMAFREPFDKANDTVQEYHTGQRLQDSETLLEDMNDYQLNSATDHFSSNPAILSQFGLKSVVDSVRDVGETLEEKEISGKVADALDATARDSRELQGRFIERLLMQEAEVSLSPRESELVQIYMVHRRRDLPIPAEAQRAYDAPDSKVKFYVDFLSALYKEARDLQLEAGMKVYSPSKGEFRTAGEDPNYVPETLSLQKRRELQGDFGLALQKQAKEDILEFWRMRRDSRPEGSTEITDGDLEVALNKYISKSVDFDSDLGSTKFGALRKVQGLGLPPTMDAGGKLTWIEASALPNATRYFKRYADDLAFYRNVENNRTVRAALGIAHEGQHSPTLINSPFTTRTKTEFKEGVEIQMNAGMTNHPLVQNFMKGYLGYYEGSELVGRTVNRLITSHWLGFMSGTRDLFTSYTLALPYLDWNNASALVSSLTDWKKSWLKSHLQGVNKRKTNRIEFGMETHNKILNGLDSWSDWAAKLGGRNFLERATRTMQFGLGRALTLQNAGAPETNRLAMRTLQTLGKMSGVDYRLLRRHADKETKANKDFEMEEGNALFKAMNDERVAKGLSKLPTHDEALDRMAAAWVEVNQGTYDVRGVPSWTLFGPPSLFTSLSRWTIEKTTRMDRDILGPLFDEKDIRPLIKATLGAVFTGSVLTYISNFIYNKIQGAPMLEEALAAENNEEARYTVVNMLNQTGYFGLVSALLNDWARFEQGYDPDIPGGFVFPAYDFFTNTLSDPIFDATRAIEEGAPVLATYAKAFNDVMMRTTQSYRIAMQWTLKSEEMEKANMRRNYRVFRRLEGFSDAPVSPDVGNKYLRPATREFKEAETLEEMVERVPKALDEQIERAQGRSDKLKSYVQGMYTTSDKTMPSVKTDEGVEEFLRYRQYMMDLGRGKDWQRTFNVWARRKQMAPARKALVKSYVQHRVATGG